MMSLSKKNFQVTKYRYKIDHHLTSKKILERLACARFLQGFEIPPDFFACEIDGKKAREISKHYKNRAYVGRSKFFHPNSQQQQHFSILALCCHEKSTSVKSMG